MLIFKSLDDFKEPLFSNNLLVFITLLDDPIIVLLPLTVN